MSVKWITYQGKRILYVDYRGCKTEQAMIEVLEEEVKILASLPTKTLALCNYAGTAVGPEYMKEAKRWGVAVGVAKLEKNAMLGITGLKSILVQGYIQATRAANTQAFETEEKALAWLISNS